MKLEPREIAQVTHAANRQYALTLGEDVKPWDELSKERQDGIVQGVVNYLTGVTHSPEQAHESWLVTMRQNGWTYGEKRDEENKTHPYMKPYHELSMQQQRKDAMFVGIIKALSYGEGSRWGNF